MTTQVNERFGLDVANRSAALRDVFWSTAVQHGPHGAEGVIANALRPLLRDNSINDIDDEAIIRAIYAERGRMNARGGLVYFPGVSGCTTGLAQPLHRRTRPSSEIASE